MAAGATLQRCYRPRRGLLIAAALVAASGCASNAEEGAQDFWRSLPPSSVSSVVSYDSAREMAEASDMVVIGTVVAVREGRPLTVIADGKLIDDPQGEFRTTTFSIEVESVLAGDDGPASGAIVELEIDTLGQRDVDRTRLPSRRAAFFLDRAAGATSERTGVDRAEAERRFGDLLALTHPSLAIQIEQDGRVVSALEPPAHGNEYHYMTGARTLDQLAEELRSGR